MKKRESFNNKWGFVLACIGSAVGMGNIWMFPTRVSLYGGGSYLIPYFIFVILIGFTGVIGEMSFGRATKSGPVDAFGYACGTKGKRKLGEILGFIPVLGALAMAIGYTVVMGWILKYMIGAFTGSTLAPENVESFGAAFGSTASAFGNNLWQIIALAVGIIILMFGIGNGIEKANKILMPLFFILFIILAIYTACQPGAAEGYKYIFRIEPKVLADPKTWIYALGQAFFSLSVAGNGTLIYGSYLPDEENIPEAAGQVALFDTIAALLAALVIIPVMAHYLPVKGLEQLMQTIYKVRKQINRKLQIDGILLTMVDRRTNFSKEIIELLHDNYGEYINIFKTAIPFSIRAAETSAEGVSIYKHDPKGRVAEAYKKLVEEVIGDGSERK